MVQYSQLRGRASNVHQLQNTDWVFRSRKQRQIRVMTLIKEQSSRAEVNINEAFYGLHCHSEIPSLFWIFAENLKKML